MKIQITIPAAKITIAYEGLTFKSVEEEVLAMLKQSGRTALEAVIQCVDEQEHRTRQNSLQSRGKAVKYVDTVCGEICARRRRYGEQDKPGGRYLADEKLGLGKRELVSPGKQKAEIETAVESRSYRKAAAAEERWTGQQRSHESIRQQVVKEGQRIKQERQAQIRQEEMSIYDTDADNREDQPIAAPEVVYAEADSVYVSIQRKRRSVMTRKPKRRKPQKAEIKLGIVYSGHEQRYRQGCGEQKRLKNKHVHVGVNEHGNEFMKQLSILAELRYMLSKARHVIVGGDGASWIREGVKDHFIHGVYVLCRYHLNRALKRALGYNKVLERQVRGLLKRNQITGSIRCLERVIEQADTVSKKQVKKLKDLRQYILSNADGINGIENVTKGMSRAARELFRRTGAIEGNVDKVIAQRMKGTGMSWSVRGAESIAYVMSNRMSGEWEQWWLKGRNRTIEVDEQAYRQLSVTSFCHDRTPLPEGTVLGGGLPALQGPHQDHAYARVLRDMSEGQLVAG